MTARNSSKVVKLGITWMRLFDRLVPPLTAGSELCMSITCQHWRMVLFQAAVIAALRVEAVRPPP